MTVHTIHGGGQMTAQEIRALFLLDEAVAKAISDADDAGVPRGLMVAILHAHAHRETHAMVFDAT